MRRSCKLWHLKDKITIKTISNHVQPFSLVRQHYTKDYYGNIGSDFLNLGKHQHSSVCLWRKGFLTPVILSHELTKLTVKLPFPLNTLGWLAELGTGGYRGATHAQERFMTQDAEVWKMLYMGNHTGINKCYVDSYFACVSVLKNLFKLLFFETDDRLSSWLLCKIMVIESSSALFTFIFCFLSNVVVLNQNGSGFEMFLKK